jgi:hypothetical protein
MDSKNGSREALGSLPMQLNPVLKFFYSMTIVTEIGDGSNALFWEDRWIAGQHITDITPTIVNMVPNKWIKKEQSMMHCKMEIGSMIFEVKQ